MYKDKTVIDVVPVPVKQDVPHPPTEEELRDIFRNEKVQKETKKEVSKD